MYKSAKLFKVIILLLLCLSLNSCLSVNRKIKLNSNGSGEEVLTVTFMKEFYSIMSSMTTLMDSSRKQSFLDSLYSDEIFVNKTKSKYDSIPGIKIIDIRGEKNYDSSQSFVINYTFDSLSRIGSLLEKTVDDDENGKENPETIVTMEQKGDNVVFDYSFEQKMPEGLSDGDSLADQMQAGIMQMFGNSFVNFEIEFPYEVVSSNATSSKGNTLTWNYPLTEIFMKSQMKLEAIMKQ